MRKAAHSQLDVKDKRKLPRDPVRRFPLSNDAVVHDVHAHADISSRKLKQSCGAMVNYLNNIDQVETHHESYATQGKIAATRAMRQLARAGQE
ncbi:MAG: malonyl-CoA decarboxylase family protein [Natronohydrobacter sp.]|nr:malonyl-CoA decarboxylase family protein [Natronohydrobacter sp.]